MSVLEKYVARGGVEATFYDGGVCEVKDGQGNTYQGRARILSASDAGRLKDASPSGQKELSDQLLSGKDSSGEGRKFLLFARSKGVALLGPIQKTKYMH